MYDVRVLDLSLAFRGNSCVACSTDPFLDKIMIAPRFDVT